MCNNTCNLTKKHFIGVLCSFNNDEYNTKNFIIKNWVNGEIIVYTIDIYELFTHISDSIIDKMIFMDEVIVSCDAVVNSFNRLTNFESVEVYAPVDVY